MSNKETVSFPQKRQLQNPYSKITMTYNMVLYYTVTALVYTYTKVTALLLWSISTVTMYYLHSYSVGVHACVSKVTVESLQRSSTITSV